MTIEIWKDFTSGGFVMGVYTFLRTFDIITAIVLCQLIAEYNHAYNNKLTYNDEFLFSCTRITNYLGIEQNDLMLSLQELAEERFIDYGKSGIEDTAFVRIYPYKIINFKKTVEAKYLYGDWNDGLKSSQNPTYKITNFENATNDIKKFIDEHIKNADTIPMVAYAHLDNAIYNLIQNNKQIVWDISVMEEYLYNMISKADFNQYDFDDLICFIKKLNERKNFGNFEYEIPMEDV